MNLNALFDDGWRRHRPDDHRTQRAGVDSQFMSASTRIRQTLSGNRTRGPTVPRRIPESWYGGAFLRWQCYRFV